MPKPIFHDDDDDDDDVTTFEPNPWGARQRVAPRRTFKAAVSRIITLVPSLVRQLPPPIPARRRVAAGTPAAPIAIPRPSRPALSEASEARMLPVRPTPLPPPTPTVGSLAIAPLAFAPPHHAYAVPSLASAKRPVRAQTWPHKPGAPRTKRILAAAAGGMLVLIIALVYTLSSRPDAATQARAQIGASLARNTAAPALVPMTVTPIEDPAAPAIAPTITELAPAAEPEPAKQSTKKARAKKPRRIVAGDTSTPLGNLRPR